jgi:hypothetical protein
MRVIEIFTIQELVKFYLYHYIYIHILGSKWDITFPSPLNYASSLVHIDTIYNNKTLHQNFKIDASMPLAWYPPAPMLLPQGCSGSIGPLLSLLLCSRET